MFDRGPRTARTDGDGEATRTGGRGPVRRGRFWRPTLRKSKRWELAVLLVAAWIAFLMGVIGFLVEPMKSRDGEKRTYDVSTAVYHTIALFKGRFPESSYDVPPPWELNVARFLAPAALWLAALRGALFVLRREEEVRRARRKRDHVVVCGLGRRGRRLAELFRERGDPVVAIERHESAPGVERCRSLGGLVLVGDATEPTLLRRAAVHRARQVIGVCGDDETNAEIASAVEALIGLGGERPSRLFHIGDDQLREAFNQRMILAASPSPPLTEFFSVSERGAFALLRQVPELADPEKARDVRMLLLGLRGTGAALLLAIARVWNILYPNGYTPLSITVVDPGVDEGLVLLGLRHPGLFRNCELVPVGAGTDSLEFEMGSLLELDGHRAPTIAYVCLENEAESLAAALSLRRALPAEVPVVVSVLSASDSAGRFLAGGNGGRGRIELVGLIEASCTPESLEGNFETMARAIHETYQTLDLPNRVRPNRKRWEDLDERVKEDNRSQAHHIDEKLRALGYSLVPLDDEGNAILELAPNDLEELAEMEHRRWVEARRAEGWTRGPRDDQSRRHPDVVEWAQLAEDSREIDRAFVRALPRILATVGLAIRRRPAPARAEELGM